MTRTCPRCGIRRTVNASRDPGLCRDCRDVDPTWPDLPEKDAA